MTRKHLGWVKRPDDPDWVYNLTLKQAEGFVLRHGKRKRTLRWFIKHKPELLDRALDRLTPGTRRFCAVVMVCDYYAEVIAAAVEVHNTRNRDRGQATLARRRRWKDYTHGHDCHCHDPAPQTQKAPLRRARLRAGPLSLPGGSAGLQPLGPGHAPQGGGWTTDRNRREAFLKRVLPEAPKERPLLKPEAFRGL